MWQLYKYQPINQIVLRNLAQRKLWASNPRVFNDPFEFRLQKANDAIGLAELRKQNPQIRHLTDKQLNDSAVNNFEEKTKNWAVVCFTEVCDSILMWAHYAGSHSGVCLGFCGIDENDTPQKHAVYPVKYVDDYPKLDWSKGYWNMEGSSGIVLTKSTIWAYEKEWRSINAVGERLEEYPGRLNKIIFGLRTVASDRRIVSSILTNEKGIDYYQVVQDDIKYKIHLQAAAL